MSRAIREQAAYLNGKRMNTKQVTSFSVADARSGKLGLALSGGGFRAALFHIGVLAQLAEQDLLRQVSVISTVSGGSIIGAFYYLKLKQLLEGKRRDQALLSARIYLQLVREIEREFLAAMQQNLRIMAFADRRKNARMLSTGYSPTQRMAELFDTLFFNPINGCEPNLLKDLSIRSVAPDAGECFVLPTLVINATALNTGHQFQFTGTHVGESSIASIVGGGTAMPLLPRLRLDDPGLHARQRVRLGQITLGEAVAASCCIPGLFEPLALHGLYEGRDGEHVVVRLVDGGVFDNQGLVSLFEEECTHFICSDASECLQWESRPAELIHTVAMRANDIMMDRIRNDLVAELMQRGPGHYVMFNLGEADGNSALGQDSSRFLAALRSVRTDLDAFTDVEAYSLMYHGYMLSRERLGGNAGNEPAQGGSDHRGEAGWSFAIIPELAADPRERARLLRCLEIGARQFFKVFYLGSPVPWIIVFLVNLIPVGSVLLLIYLLPPIPTSAWVVLGLLVLSAVAYVQNARIIEWVDQVDWLKRARYGLAAALKPVGVTVMLGMVGALATWVNLRILNRLFLSYGAVKRGDGDKPYAGPRR
ncbi:MAG: patatin-like phospholipase family protein [Halioglobus sp.]|nr:patatin-like phospholipase family protein [Halioglobus sp.]